ncbi:hypothetical protein HNO89_000067 [Sporosarcina luteola]|nr:hypothetical protein [Sporosarcina luteola]
MVCPSSVHHELNDRQTLQEKYLEDRSQDQIPEIFLFIFS